MHALVAVLLLVLAVILGYVLTNAATHNSDLALIVALTVLILGVVFFLASGRVEL